jgi:hypothetical protein
MNFRIIDIQKDNNLDCYSVLTVVGVSYFMDFIDKIHENKGNIDEQRGVLSTRSAKIIREQMVKDLQGGGVLPPIVLGSIYDQFIDKNNFSELIYMKRKEDEISILDGMQRIQALKDATYQHPINHELRVEFWFAYDESALLYRMLVLNSGQIPWGLEKQLKVVFKPILKQLKARVRLSESSLEEIHSDYDILELFLAFTSRKVRIDRRQQLAEYHSALDIMSLVRERSSGGINKFEDVFQKMIEIDFLLKDIQNRYVFDNQTARLGFVVACSEAIFGLLGNREENDHEKVNKNFNYVIEKLEKIKDKIQTNNNIVWKENYLSLDVLRDTLRSIPKEKHRQAFLDGFKVIFSASEIHSLAVCWNKMY